MSREDDLRDAERAKVTSTGRTLADAEAEAARIAEAVKAEAQSNP